MSKTLNNEIIWEELEDEQGTKRRNPKKPREKKWVREWERAMRKVQHTIVQEGRQTREVRGGEVRVMHVCVRVCVCQCQTKSKRLSVQLPASLSNQWRNLCLYFPHATTRLSTPYPCPHPHPPLHPHIVHLPAALSNIYLHLSYNNSLMHWTPGTGSH